MYIIYVYNTLPPALAVHEIYRDIFGPPMVSPMKCQRVSVPKTIKVLS